MLLDKKSPIVSSFRFQEKPCCQPQKHPVPPLRPTHVRNNISGLVGYVSLSRRLARSISSLESRTKEIFAKLVLLQHSPSVTVSMLYLPGEGGGTREVLKAVFKSKWESSQRTSREQGVCFALGDVWYE